MSGEIQNTTSVAQQYYPTADQLLESAGVKGEGESVGEILGAATANLQCVQSFQTMLQGLQHITGNMLIDEMDLDEVDREMLTEMDMDVQKLIGELQGEIDEKTLVSMKERVEQLKAKLDKLNESRLTKVQNSIDEQRKADEAAKRNKIFSIFGAIVAVISAVITTVVTGGAAAVFAFAGAALAVTNCVLTCTGGDKKIMDLIADLDQKCHPEHTMKQSKEFANKFYAYTGLALGAVIAIGGMGASFMQAPKEVVEVFGKVLSEAVKKGLQWGSGIVGGVQGIIGMSFGLDASLRGVDAQEANSDLKEAESYLVKFQNFLEQEQEDIEELMQALQQVFAQLIDMIDGTANNKDELLEGMSTGAGSFA